MYRDREIVFWRTSPKFQRYSSSKFGWVIAEAVSSSNICNRLFNLNDNASMIFDVKVQLLRTDYISVMVMPYNDSLHLSCSIMLDQLWQGLIVSYNVFILRTDVCILCRCMIKWSTERRNPRVCIDAVFALLAMHDLIKPSFFSHDMSKKRLVNHPRLLAFSTSPIPNFCVYQNSQV